MLIEASSNWENSLHDRLIEIFGERKGEKHYVNYLEAFPDAFKNSYHFGATCADIIKIEEAYKCNGLSLELYQREEDDASTFHLKFYHPTTKVMLSDVLPMLENMGFCGVDERIYCITPQHYKDCMWVHHFRLQVDTNLLYKPENKTETSIDAIKEAFEEAMLHVWHGQLEDDGFNKLITYAKMHWRDVMLLRAYSRYAIQTALPYSHSFNASVVERYPVLSSLLVELFKIRFAPGLNEAKREKRIDELQTSIQRRLSGVRGAAEDRVMRQLHETILATLRTNMYQTTEKGEHKPIYLSS